MSDVYLSSMDIENFRTFGGFNVVLPAAPGLLLLTGTNGLGKSSFFDAIEWALSSKIRRFLPYVSRAGRIVIPESDYLTRHGAPSQSHAVTLKFSEGEALRRSATEAPSAAAVSALIAYPGRGETTDLSTHLAMTHFLGQAERQRFTSREADDQWAALKGPSGIDRLELIRTRLRGKATTLAFGRRIKAEQGVISAIEKEIADWLGWQARLDRLHQAIRAGGGLTVQDVRLRAQEIELEASLLLEREPAGIAGESNSQLLARLTGLLDLGLQELSDRSSNLAAAEELVDKYQTQQALGREDNPILVRVRQHVTDALAAAEAGEPLVAPANNSVTEQIGAISSIENEIARLEATRADLLRREELVGILADAQTEIDGRNADIALHRSLVIASETSIQVHSAASADCLRLQAIADRAQENVETIDQLNELARSAEEHGNILTLAVESAAGVRVEFDTAILRRDELLFAVEAGRRELGEAERHATAIESAVATIASHIHENEEICPVCSAEYPAGQLKFLVSEAAKSGDLRVAEATSRLDLLETELAPLAQRVEDLLQILRRPEQLEPVTRNAVEQVKEVRQRLAELLGLDADGDLASAVLSRNERAQLDLQTARSALADLASLATAAQQQRALSNAELDQLAKRLDAAMSRMSLLSAEDRDCAERIAARGMPAMTIDDVSSLLSDRRNDLEIALARLVELRDLAGTATSALASLQQQVVVQQDALAAAELAMRNARLGAETLVEQWSTLNLPGVPDRTILDDVQAKLSNASVRLKLLSGRLQELAKVNQDVLLDEEIVLVTEQMRVAGGNSGVVDPKAHLSELQSRLAPARAALKLSQDAHDAIDKYTVKLGDRAEAYNRDVLEPLNDRILEFNAAMLSTPGASVQFKADKRVDRTDFAMELRYGDEVDDSIQSARQVPAQLVLSEGQLAANGFSILCAASTAYRWSRWRALLLDDPLQHNDVIHTAAFVDLMRNLVELEGYQLIMSSHDRAESEFIARKFDAAGLACTTVLLTSPSENGVAFDPPTYNSVARNYLNGLTPVPRARSA